MQFNSIPFFLFLLVVVFLYYTIPPRFRNCLLLTASYFFYFSAKAEYLILLLASTGVNYLSGIAITRYPIKKKMFLGISLSFNLGVLFFFKYFNFFGSQLNELFNGISLPIILPQHSLILPIGISFYTFMAVGYVLDVYWGDIKHQRNYLTFSLYMAFFPQILCGPIGRAKNLFKQLTDEHHLKYENFSNGFRLILWGLFKKMVIADNLAVYVDAVFNNVPQHSSVSLIFVALLFPMQLYTDFSGYTDVARGVARLLGFDLMVNFRSPYINSTTVSEYWKRNHISLTSWFRDYIFYPFIGTSLSKLKLYLGILIMFVASGFWHGSTWLYMIWGCIQALYLILEDVFGVDTRSKRVGFVSYLKRAYTYVLISIGLVFFRLSDFGQLSEFIQRFVHWKWHLYTGSKSVLAMGLFGAILLVFFELSMDKLQIDSHLATKSVYFRWTTYIILFWLIIITGNVGGQSFIYFRY